MAINILKMVIFGLCIIAFANGYNFEPLRTRWGDPKCPIIGRLPTSECKGRTKSTCWSPGVRDTDCPGHALCCFDGCANTCPDITPVTTPPPPTYRPTYGPTPTTTTVPPPPEKPSCRYETKIIHDIEQKEEFVTNCTQGYKCVCGEKYQKNCITYSEDKPVCKTILKPKCETRYRKKCVSNSRDIEEPYDTEECNSKEVEICDKIWIDKGNGVKEWADDPDTCQTLTKTVCHTVTKFRKVKDALQTIEEESYEHCQNVEENFCQIIKVEKEQCENEAVTECTEIPYEDCKTIHKLVPHQVSRKKTVKICDDNVDTDSNLTFPDNDDFAREDQPESVPALVYSGNPGLTYHYQDGYPNQGFMYGFNY